ncbi:taste receptor type 2 member 4-like [Hyperolius riggenbachi]|uniref:taste receptor type 2 member 4-like n=1 Tax=Hyperolius riggenbachi TaxID=752182 RepID=UPI0035A2EB93
MGHSLQILKPVLLVECILAIAVNVFIAAVQIMKWKAVRSLDSCDQILFCLGISRSFYLTVIFITYFLDISKHLILYATLETAAFLSYFTNVWFITDLCVFYCVKIASYNHEVFIFIKTRISRLVSWFTVTSVLTSVAFTIPCVWSSVVSSWQNEVSVFNRNVTLSDAGLQKYINVQLIFFILGSCIPFFISCGSICLLIHSLWRHTRLMRCSGTGFRNPNIENHVGVVKNMGVFLFIQLIMFGCSLYSFFMLKCVDRSWQLLSTILECGSFILHSAYMIYSNVKLNQAFSGMCHGLIRCI